MVSKVLLVEMANKEIQGFKVQLVLLEQLVQVVQLEDKVLLVLQVFKVH